MRSMTVQWALLETERVQTPKKLVWTPLHWAGQSNQKDMAVSLIRAGRVTLCLVGSCFRNGSAVDGGRCVLSS